MAVQTMARRAIDFLLSWKERYFSSGTPPEPRARSIEFSDDWDARPAKQLRYAVGWAFYEGTQYNDAIHAWVGASKESTQSYEAIRTVFSCVYRLIEWWSAHLWGGPWDPDAGDGKKVPSCLPIVTKSEQVRKAIALTLANSQWSINKDVAPRFGAAMGDVGLMLDDDPVEQKIAIRIIDPRTIIHSDFDCYGRCTEFQRQEFREDPREDHVIEMATGGHLVRYVERAHRIQIDTVDGKPKYAVKYETYLEDELFPWDPDQGAEWTEDYPFVPFVLIQHNNVGRKSGFSESFPILTKLRESDNLGSALVDFIIKSVDAPWLYAGVYQGQQGFEINFRRTRSGDFGEDTGQENRYTIPSITGPPEARAQALIANLDISASAHTIEMLRDEIEKDYPELIPEIKMAQGDASGKALRTARQRTERKAAMRRSGYDAGLERILKMAMAVGGTYGYPGYEGLATQDVDDPKLAFRIGERPIFSVDPLDKLEVDEKFWSVAESAVRSGYPLELFLKDQGYSDEQVADYIKNRDEAAAKLQAQQEAMAKVRAPNMPNTAPRQAKPKTQADKNAVQSPGGM